jgi:hypothetical protein
LRFGAHGALTSAPMENEMIKRLAWMGFVAGLEALASIAALRLAAFVWQRFLDEDPPS